MEDLRVGITKMKTKVKCPRCENYMSKMTTCHLICDKCGANLDCSDKGNFW